MFLAVFVLVASHCGATESAEKQKRDLQIEQLKLQRKILETMDLYKEFSQTSVVRVKGLSKLLGNTSYSEAVELFQSGKIPNELIPAHSEWRGLVANETHRWCLRIALDNWARKNELLKLELKIEEIGARIKIGGVLTKDDLEDIERMRKMAEEAVVPPVSDADQLEGATKAKESIERMMSNIKKGKTE